MKITRLHILLLVIIFALAGLGYYQYDQNNRQKAELAALVAKQTEQKRLEEQRQQEEKTKKENWARQTIAVAGEIRVISKKKGRDISKGQETLRLAKDSYDKTDYDSAIDLSLQSIQELETAPYLDINYTVRRGDCLWNIAKKPEHYGRGAGWVKIWKANKKKIPDYDLIHPKQILKIPKSQPQNTKNQPESGLPNS
ncbi:MAG: LysM peptidoglycan-binding domain-containing protein [Elusimicrobiota bacterium]